VCKIVSDQTEAHPLFEKYVAILRTSDPQRQILLNGKSHNLEDILTSRPDGELWLKFRDKLNQFLEANLHSGTREEDTPAMLERLLNAFK